MVCSPVKTYLGMTREMKNNKYAAFHSNVVWNGFK